MTGFLVKQSVKPKLLNLKVFTRWKKIVIDLKQFKHCTFDFF